MIDAQDMTAGELATLLHFHAEAGVEWLVEETAIDRFQEFAAMQSARKTASAPTILPNNSSQSSAGTSPNPAKAVSPKVNAAAPRPVEANVALPDERAIEMARDAAHRAMSLDELRQELQTFTGCNLKNSARHTVFADGNAESGILVVGPMPTADDDRDGIPFSGKQGELLARMLAAIGLDRTKCLISHTIPWRPPGNRMPTSPEMEICRPFIERQIALVKPQHILLLGNFATKFFIDSPENIQTLRGKWRDITVAGISIPALPTLHPSDLMTAPISKRLAWADLLEFKARISG